MFFHAKISVNFYIFWLSSVIIITYYLIES